MPSIFHRVAAVRLAGSGFLAIVPRRVRRRVLLRLDYFHLYMSEAELVDLIGGRLADCEFSLTFFADATNRKIGCMLRLRENARRGAF